MTDKKVRELIKEKVDSGVPIGNLEFLVGSETLKELSSLPEVKSGDYIGTMYGINVFVGDVNGIELHEQTTNQQRNTGRN